MAFGVLRAALLGFVAIIVYSYGIYPFVLSFLSAIFRRPTRKSEDHLPTVSFVVPAYNEEQVILRKIQNILALEYPENRIAVWVGSDQSTDSTEEIVRAVNDPRVHLWVASQRGGKTQVLNQVIPLVDSEVVVLTDANTMHRPDSLRALVRHFHDPEVGGVAGHIDHRTANKEQSKAEILYREFESRLKKDESLLHSTTSAYGGFYAIRKELFRPLPSNAFSNDDVLIPMNIVRQGKRVLFDPDAISDEDFTEDVSFEYRRRVRIGAGNYQSFFWLLDFLNPFRGWPFFCYLSHKVMRWFSPLCLFGAIVSALALGLVTDLMVYRTFSAIISLVVALGILAGPRGPSILRLAHYFLVMNAALVAGFWVYLSGIKSAAWSRTARN